MNIDLEELARRKYTADLADLEDAFAWGRRILCRNIHRYCAVILNQPFTMPNDNKGVREPTVDKSISYIIHPGTREGLDEYHAFLRIVRQIVPGQWRHGTIPDSTALREFDAAVTNEIEFLRKCVPCHELEAYASYANEILGALQYQGTPFGSAKSFEADLDKMVDLAMEARKHLSFAVTKMEAGLITHEQIFSAVKEVKLSSDKGFKKLGKKIDLCKPISHRKYTNAVQDRCHDIWMRWKDDETVKGLNAGKTTHKAVFIRRKQELEKLGIMSPEAFDDVLHLWSCRHYRESVAC